MRFRPHLSFALLAALFVILWFAGGASRADVIGQVFTRGAAWAILIAFILLAPRPRLGPVTPVAIFVFAAVALAALHLLPLPPAIWTGLPGREVLTQAAILTGQEQPWRPLSISPDATVNALSSLIVPVVVVVLAAGLSSREHWLIAVLLLALVVAASLIGLLQFTGARFDHPLINDVPDAVSATFANRNHFALFAAIGCLLAPAWAYREGRAHWKGPVALLLVLLFGLIILATGSRMGMLLGALGIGLGVTSIRHRVAAELRALPRKVSIVLVATGAGLLAVVGILSVVLGRAVSIERILSLEVGQDLRRQALPVVTEMTWLYFPFGTGLGTFDPVYRMHEPDALLSTLYFNRAHNDLVEVVLDAGLPALLLLVAAIGWWLWQSLRAWRAANGPSDPLARAGSGIMFLVLVASLTDYPARTPMIMALLVIAAVWLGSVRSTMRERGSSASLTRRPGAAAAVRG